MRRKIQQMSFAHFLQQPKIQGSKTLHPNRPQLRQRLSAPDRFQNGISSLSHLNFLSTIKGGLYGVAQQHLPHDSLVTQSKCLVVVRQ